MNPTNLAARTKANQASRQSVSSAEITDSTSAEGGKSWLRCMLGYVLALLVTLLLINVFT